MPFLRHSPEITRRKMIQAGVMGLAGLSLPDVLRLRALAIEDLYSRGLHQRVLVVVMGEFGRTPRFEVIGSNKPGRDHWGDAMSVMMSGGGLAGGQVIGATDRLGWRPSQSPIRIERVLATLYRHLGIDPAQTVNDLRGRPRNLLEIREPIPQLS